MRSNFFHYFPAYCATTAEIIAGFKEGRKQKLTGDERRRLPAHGQKFFDPLHPSKHKMLEPALVGDLNLIVASLLKVLWTKHILFHAYPWQQTTHERCELVCYTEFASCGDTETAAGTPAQTRSAPAWHVVVQRESVFE